MSFILDSIDCKLLVSSAIKDDISQMDPSHTINAVNLCLKDERNVTRIIENVIPYLSKEEIMFRVKALRFLKYLASKGPDSVRAVLKSFSQQINGCTEMTTKPHPILGNSPFEELKSSKKELYDIIFQQTQNRSRVSSTSVADHLSSGRSYDKVVSNGAQEQSLDSRYINEKESLLSNIKNKIFKGKNEQKPDIYGSVNFQGQQTFGTTGVSSSQIVSSGTVPTRSIIELESGVNHMRVSIPTTQQQEQSHVSVFLVPKIKASPAPSRNEINEMRNKLDEQSIYELLEGLKNGDFRTRYRAVFGLGLYADKYGASPVASYKDDILKLTNATEKILKDEAKKLFERIKDVSPGPVPVESQFEFE